MVYKGFCALVGLIALGQAHADFENFAIVPANPVVGQEVFLVFDSIFPDIAIGASVSQADNTLDVFISNGTRIDPNPPVLEQRISLGLPSIPGDYTVNISFSSFGTAPQLSFTVSPATPVPALSQLGIFLLALSFIGVAALLFRRGEAPIGN